MKNPQPKEWLAEKYSNYKVADYKPFNFVDGEGVRCSLYLSGCLFACEGCYNKIAQNFDYGVMYTDELEEQIMADLRQPYVQGLTLLGGEPFLNTQVALRLAGRIRAEFGDTKDIWCWTGYYWDELAEESEDKLALLELDGCAGRWPLRTVQARFDIEVPRQFQPEHHRCEKIAGSQ